MTHQPPHGSPHDKVADAVHEGRPVEAQYVRQGRGGMRMLTLLVVSATAAAILLLGMWFLSQGGFANTNSNIGGQAVDAQAFQTDAGERPAADAPTTATGEPAVPQAGAAPNVNAAVAPAAATTSGRPQG